MITEYILTKLVDSSLNIVKRILKETMSKLISTNNNFLSAINYHLRFVKNWSSEISFTDLKSAKKTRDVFVELELYLYPRRIKIDSKESIFAFPLKDLFLVKKGDKFLFLSKYHWYADMLSFRELGRSMTGATYERRRICVSGCGIF